MPLPFTAAAVGVAASKVAGSLISGVINASKNSVSINSLADLSRPLRVEPIVIIDNVLADQPYMSDLMKMCATQFAAYYLQAVNMVMGVGKIDTLKVFDALNPMRSESPLNKFSQVFSKELYSEGLPSLESFEQKAWPGVVFQEQRHWHQASLEDVANSEENRVKGPTLTAGIDQNGGRIFENENLAVGKLLSVEVSSGTEKAKLPVMIRLVPAVVPSDTLVHIFNAGGRDSWSHRFFLVTTGQLRAWDDLVLGRDMIDAHLKALMTDSSGVYKKITDRRRNNVMHSALTGKVSMADASNIAIISSNTFKETANSLYSKIDDPGIRNKIFDNSYLLMLLVVEERHSRVSIYHRGMDNAASYRLDDIKNSEKSKGADITEVFKMFSKSFATNI